MRRLIGSVRASVRRANEAAKWKSDFAEAKLKRLYKLVHPDKLHRLPSERAVNEQSLARLRQWLSEAERGSNASAAGSPCTVSFYIRDGEQLRRVEERLPPPSRSRRESALARLLKALGDEEEGEYADPSGQGANDSVEGVEAEGLAEHLRGSAEAVRRMFGGSQGYEGRLQRVKTALRLGRSVGLRFGQGSTADPQKKAEAAERLVRALDRIGTDGINGIVVVMGDREGLERGGDVAVRWDASEGQMEAALKRVDPEQISSLKREREALEKEEERAAASLGIGMVLSEVRLGRETKYLDLLRGVVSANSHKGQRAHPHLGDVPLIVLEGGEFRVDFDRGALEAPLESDPGQVRDFVANRGKEAANVLEEENKARRAEARAAEWARRQLGASRVARDEGRVSRAAFSRACERLGQAGFSLEKVAHGLNLRVSDANRGPWQGEGGVVYVDIAHDAPLLSS